MFSDTVPKLSFAKHLNNEHLFSPDRMEKDYHQQVKLCMRLQKTRI